MKKHGIKQLDPIFDAAQLDWLIVSTKECPTLEEEQTYANTYFRPTHDPSGNDKSYVRPVYVRRSRRRILFYQQSGVEV